ncbi:hypothetical protein M885DRAFT_503697 [Pelagophyceae sp. CCMP2097]|nr:hypothetical protein M885DRAFT_503697 [Pelagophyceae sp. CCMP2097]
MRLQVRFNEADAKASSWLLKVGLHSGHVGLRPRGRARHRQVWRAAVARFGRLRCKGPRLKLRGPRHSRRQSLRRHPRPILRIRARRAPLAPADRGLLARFGPDVATRKPDSATLNSGVATRKPDSATLNSGLASAFAQTLEPICPKRCNFPVPAPTETRYTPDPKSGKVGP